MAKEKKGAAAHGTALHFVIALMLMAAQFKMMFSLADAGIVSDENMPPWFSLVLILVVIADSLLIGYFAGEALTRRIEKNMSEKMKRWYQLPIWLIGAAVIYVLFFVI